jgi:Xaa-Pro aminopeptidase
MQVYADRLQRIRAELSPAQAFLFSQSSDLTYFTGFRTLTANEREGFVLVTPQTAVLFATAFSPLPEYLDGKNTVPFLEVVRTGHLGKAAEFLFQHQIKTVFIDEENLTVAEANKLQEILDELSSKTISCQAIKRAKIWELRKQKDSTEQNILRKACQITRQALEEILAELQAGQTEKQIANKLEYRFCELGADGTAFPTIVAFHDHATLPHHQPGDTPLKPETSVLIDCGAAVQGYNGDMTRTVWFGKNPSPEFTKVKEVVDKAYQVGYQLVQTKFAAKENITAQDLDLDVRHIIEQAGYGQYFIHTTGHGIGLEVHEPPSIYQTNPQQLLENMILTIEPGVYLPGKFGYRFENTILLTSQGAEELTQ